MSSQARPSVRDKGRLRDGWTDLLRDDDATGNGWSLAKPLLLLVAGWVVMAWPWLSGSVTIPWDAKAQFLPQIQFLAQSVARGESPFWAPFVFSGQNQIADPQSMIFAPPFLLLALISANPGGWAVDMTTLLTGLAGAIALLVWFRDQGWHWAGGVMAGLTFAFGASMAWRLQHIGQVLSLAYFPFALLALDRMLARRSYVWAIVLGLVGAAILVGRDQVALLVVYLVSAFALWRVMTAPEPWRALRSALPPALVAAVIAALTAVLPVLLTALLAADSNRPTIDLESAGRGSLHPALLLTTLIPHLFGAAFRMEDYWGPPSFAWSDTGLYIAQNMGQLYIGIVPLVLIVIAAARGQMWSRDIRFFVIALGLVTLYALGWYTPVFHIFYTVLPGVSFYRRPADATFVMGALLAILAGYATHRFFGEPWRRIGRSALLVSISIGAAGFVAAIVLASRIDRFALLPYPLAAAAVSMLAATVAVAFARSRLALEPWLAAVSLCGVTAVDLAWNNGPSSSSGLPPAMYDVLEPDTKDPVIATLKSRVAADQSDTRRDRIELLGLGFHWPNASLTHRLENTLGYNPVRSLLYSRATGAGDNIGSPGERTFTPLLPSYRSLLVDMLGLRYVAAGAPLEQIDKRLKPGDWTFLGRVGDAWLYENPRALPRVTFVRRAITADFDAILNSGNWPAFDPAGSVLLGGARGVYYSTGGAPGGADSKVRITAYRQGKVEIEVQSRTGGFVVLNDLWHPWWYAEVDGVDAKVERANVLFRAVEVPAGTHRIVFKFQPLRGAWDQVRTKAAPARPGG